MSVLKIRDKNGDWEEIPSLQGESATIEVGRVETVLPTQAATVTNSGTETNATFNFQIPRGVDGITPVKGIDYWTPVEQDAIVQDVTDGAMEKLGTVINALQNKPQSYVFADKAALDAAINLVNGTITINGTPKVLNVGDTFLLVSTEEPDYWYGEVSGSTEKLHELDARKVDLDAYFNSHFKVMTQEEYENLSSIDAGVFYCVYEG